MNKIKTFNVTLFIFLNTIITNSQSNNVKIDSTIVTLFKQRKYTFKNHIIFYDNSNPDKINGFYNPVTNQIKLLNSDKNDLSKVIKNNDSIDLNLKIIIKNNIYYNLEKSESKITFIPVSKKYPSFSIDMKNHVLYYRDKTFTESEYVYINDKNNILSSNWSGIEWDSTDNNQRTLIIIGFTENLSKIYIRFKTTYLDSKKDFYDLRLISDFR